MVNISRSCGIFGWRPDWLQKFAGPKSYLVVSGLVGILQGMTLSYLNSVLSTVEKRFGLKSKEAAWIYSGNEISQVICVIFIPVIGKVKNRPKVLAWSALLAALGLFVVGLPHFTGNQSYLNITIAENHKLDNVDVCHPSQQRIEDCDPKHGNQDFTSIWIVFLGIFMFGVAISMYYSFGLAYLDDNSNKSDSPFYLSVIMASRTLGPAFGYILGSVCLSYYVDPNHKPEGLTEGSPLWIGAWWMGFFSIGCGLCVVGPWLALFPDRLPDPNVGSTEGNPEGDVSQNFDVSKWIQESKAVTLRLLKRPIFAFNLISSTFFMLGVMGYFTFIPKYFEFHFRQKASRVGTTGGLSQSVSSAVGIITSGYILKKVHLRARSVALWCCAADLVFILTFSMFALIKCPPLIMFGEIQQNGIIKVDNISCNTGCDCHGVKYQPICSVDGQTNFFSPCHAGCKSVSRISSENHPLNASNKLYSDCTCIAQHNENLGNITLTTLWWQNVDLKANESVRDTESPVKELESKFLTSGVDNYCKVDCSKEYSYLVGLMFFAGFVGSSTRLPTTLLSLRSVEKEDKGPGFTLSLSVISLFATLPSPLIMGAILDETCLIWGEKCGRTTNCLVYDTDLMRQYIVIFPILCIVISFAFDIFVWYFAKDLQIFEDKNKEVQTSSL